MTGSRRTVVTVSYTHLDVYKRQHDEGYASGVIAEFYIEAVRGAGDWKELARNNRASAFGNYWARAIRDTDDADPPGPEELAAMFSAAQAGGHEDLAWDALRNQWHPDFREMLKGAISAGIADLRDSRAAVSYTHLDGYKRQGLGL